MNCWWVKRSRGAAELAHLLPMDDPDAQAFWEDDEDEVKNGQ